IDVELLDVEIARHLAEDAPRQQLERGIGRLIGVADRLALLHDIEQPDDAGIVLVDLEPDALELGEHVRFAGLLRDQQLAPVAHRIGGHVLVGRGLLHDGGSVNAGLGREGAFAHIGRVPIRRAVEHLVERVGGMRQGLELRVRDADVEAVGEFALELQRRDDGHEIGVAAALAEPVERALDLARAGAHGGKGLASGRFGALWAWMPTRSPGMTLTTSPTIFSTSCGSAPPLVSHSTTQRAPSSTAALAQASANCGLALYPSKKCSQSSSTSRPLRAAARTLSRIEARFSSGLVSSATRTW